MKEEELDSGAHNTADMCTHNAIKNSVRSEYKGEGRKTRIEGNEMDKRISRNSILHVSYLGDVFRAHFNELNPKFLPINSFLNCNFFKTMKFVPF